MKNLKALIMVMVLIFIGVIVGGCQPGVKSQVMAPTGEGMATAGKTFTVGDQVRLFHSGSEEIRNYFCVGDIVPVARETHVQGVINRTEVGKVRVLSYEGKQAITAEVVDGVVQAGNIAEKDTSACMVYLPES